MLFGHFLHRSKLPATNVNSVNRVASVRVLSDADPFLNNTFRSIDSPLDIPKTKVIII